jgi:hypothetical protein
MMLGRSAASHELTIADTPPSTMAIRSGDKREDGLLIVINYKKKAHIHPQPTLGEYIGMAAEVADGRCTNWPSTGRQGLTEIPQLPMVAGQFVATKMFETSGKVPLTT